MYERLAGHSFGCTTSRYDNHRQPPPAAQKSMKRPAALRNLAPSNTSAAQAACTTTGRPIVTVPTSRAPNHNHLPGAVDLLTRH